MRDLKRADTVLMDGVSCGRNDETSYQKKLETIDGFDTITNNQAQALRTNILNKTFQGIVALRGAVSRALAQDQSHKMFEKISNITVHLAKIATDISNTSTAAE